MGAIQKFNHWMFGEIEALVKDGEIYFPGTDVAKGLEYAIPHKAVSTHCDTKEVLTWNVPTNGGIQQKKFISLGNVDYRHKILPPLPSFLPIYAKGFTTHRQYIYQ